MSKRILAGSLVIALGSLGLLSVGCSPDSNLGGAPVPNVSPDTQITARPPDLLEGSYLVEFFWTGYDPEGRVKGYQWKLSTNGTDGISVQDTLTFDPVTGDTLNPWHFTVATDTTLLVSADINDLPSDEDGLHRGYQTHTFFVRALDDRGAVDSTPAYVSFTATTLLPQVTIDGPTVLVDQGEPKLLPRTVTISYTGSDPDFSLGIPTKIRFLWKKALLPNGSYAQGRVQVQENIDYLASFDDSLWSNWEPFPRIEDNRQHSWPGQVRLDGLDIIRYIMVAQVQDTAGAVSIDRSYGINVAHIQIKDDFSPALTIQETYLPSIIATGLDFRRDFDIAAGQPVTFEWGASAEDYLGRIVSYRYGWDLTDPDDPDDPGWAVLPGNAPQHRRAPTRAFASGTHSLTVQVKDNSDQTTRATINLIVVPVPDPASQNPLLLIDDVYDKDSGSWPGHESPPIPYDNDTYRDQFWLQALDGHVTNFDHQRDIFDLEEVGLAYRDVVKYKTIIWASKTNSTNYVVQNFRPSSWNQDRFNWLTSYQDRVGNLLICGARSMMNFFYGVGSGAYALPVIFESREGSPDGGYTGAAPGYRVGWGQKEQPDGTFIQIGPTRYGAATWGLSVVDVMAPSTTDVIYGTDPLTIARIGRKTACVGIKALVLDPDFKARHMPEGVNFPDTIPTEPLIDWRDLDPAYYNNLVRPYNWGDEEFYDSNVAIARSTYYQLQQCENSEIDSTKFCVEPMFRGLARIDWIRKKHLDVDPNDTWPQGYYSTPMDELCGRYALNDVKNSARTNNQPIGFLSYKTSVNKPSQVPDICWGFDPHRYEHTEMAKAIRWVLGSHFRLQVN